MRLAFAALVLFGASALTSGQPPKDPPPKEPPKKEVPKDDETPRPKDVGPRYGVNPRVKAYPQTTPKEALRSAVLAIDKADFTYLTAQLLDPKFIDAAVAERAKLFEPGVTTELAQLRDYQRANPGQVTPENRVPLDGRSFAALVTTRARERAFRQVAKDLEQKLSDDPTGVKEMRRVLRDGAFVDADPVATATHAEIKGRALYFRKIGERWFLENRNTEEPKKEP